MWKRVKDGKPEHDILCLVVHISRPFEYKLALYNKTWDTFDWYDPNNRDAPMALDVTAYIPLESYGEHEDDLPPRDIE